MMPARNDAAVTVHDAGNLSVDALKTSLKSLYLVLIEVGAVQASLEVADRSGGKAHTKVDVHARDFRLTQVQISLVELNDMSREAWSSRVDWTARNQAGEQIGVRKNLGRIYAKDNCVLEFDLEKIKSDRDCVDRFPHNAYCVIVRSLRLQYGVAANQDWKLGYTVPRVLVHVTVVVCPAATQWIVQARCRYAGRLRLETLGQAGGTKSLTVGPADEHFRSRLPPQAKLRRGLAAGALVVIVAHRNV